MEPLIIASIELKNKEIKKLFDAMQLYFDMDSLPSVMTSFMSCDDAIEGEITALKAELTDANRCKDIYHGSADHLRNMALERGDELRKANNQIESLKKMINELKEKLNNERKHGEDLADVNGQLASENADLKARLTLWEHSRITWRGRAQHAEKEVEDLNKRISDLEKKNANLRVTPFDTLEALKKENKKLAAACEDNKRLREVIDGKEKEINSLKKKIHELEQETADDAIRIKSLERANSVLRGDNKILWARLKKCEKCAFDISKRPWHGDANAMTGECGKSLVEAIEFQNKKIEELETEKARLKEAYDIHETTTKKENVDLSYGHEFEFGDEVFVPWSDAPYMYVKTGLLYNTRTKTLVYVGKDQHLKWFGEKFAIV